MSWDPGCYGAHADHRLRPGLELASRISIEPRLIYDLGCGTGELTNHLGSRWPKATVIGIDNSREMLKQAEEGRNVRFVEQNIESWHPAEAPPDLIFSNAALHWVGNHHHLFPRLLEMLEPGGVLAVQMPDNWDSPTHALIYQEVDRRGWSERIGHRLLRRPVATIADYVEWLADAKQVDAWRTTYYQLMTGDDPVLSWVKGTVLVPVRSTVTEEEFASLELALAADYRRAYPPLPDGVTLMPMSRIFLIARR